MAKKNKKGNPTPQALHDYLVNVVGHGLENVLQEQSYNENALIEAEDHKLTVSFPLHEDFLGDGLVGVKFYSYTVELTCTGKKVTDKVLTPIDKHPKEFVIGLANMFEKLNDTIGSLKKGKMSVHFGVAVPAQQEYGVIRYMVVMAPKGLEAVIPVTEPFEKMESKGMDIYTNQGFMENKEETVQMNIPTGQGQYPEHYPAPEPNPNLGMLDGFGPMGPTSMNQNPKPQEAVNKPASPYETEKPVSNYGFDPYANNYDNL